MSYYRTLKNPSKSPALGSRKKKKKQETSENSSQMLMFLRCVCSSRWTERICLWAFHLPLLLIFSALHGPSLAGLIAWFMATSPATLPGVENENHQQSGHHSKSNKTCSRVCVCARVPIHMRASSCVPSILRGCGSIAQQWGDFAAKLVESRGKPKILRGEGRGNITVLGFLLSLWKL